jgi:molybdate transport system substrate-binding protein
MITNKEMPDMFGKFVQRAAAVLVISAALTGAGNSAEIKLIASAALKGPLEVLMPQFEKATGNTVKMTLDSAASGRKRIEAGEQYDVVITSPALLDDLAKSGAVVAATRVAVGTTMASLAYRNGTAKPDISTPELLRAVLLKAKAISTSDPTQGGASSTYFLGLADRMGIGEDVRRKLIPTKPGEGAVPVSDGRAEIGVALSSEVAATPGVTGEPLAESDPKSKLSMVAASTSKATNAAAVQALLNYLTTPASAAIIRKGGFTTP